MRVFVRVLPLILFVSLCVLLWRGLGQDPHQLPSVLLNKPVPAFSANTVFQNTPVSNQDFIGHITIINVFATWCMVCQIEHPLWMDVARTHTVRLIGLAYKDSSLRIQSWLKKYGNPYQSVIDDQSGKLAIELGVYGTPETFLIDQNGIIRDRITGAISPDVWQQRMLPEIQRLQTGRAI